jgi:cytochrome c peroxidase
VALGKMLFFDPRLSGTEAISCATCHNPSFHWSDHLKVGRGTQHKDLGRRSPTILNAAFNDVQMWDGRFASLEEQATGPMMSTAEMNIQPDEVVVKLRALPQYQSLFRAAFGEKGITTETIVKAIASYERTIISADAPFDRYVKGDDNAISPEARRGFVLFNTKAHCATCHSGWNLSDSSFHDIGVASDDLGRGPIIGLETLNHAFKTPTLRNIQDRAPYTHNGSEKTLRDVVDLYDQGGRVKRATLSAEIKPLNLTEPEKNDLIAFLRTLTSQDAPVTLPVLP